METLKLLGVALFVAIPLCNSQSFDPRCGPPRPVIETGFEDNCPSCPSECPEGEICCPLGICGSECLPIPPNACPLGLDQEFCFAPPCLSATCSRFPDAQCTDDFCGGCNAVFSNSSLFEDLLTPSILSNSNTPIIVPQFACSGDWPDCLKLIRCRRPPFSCSNGCPRVPDAMCNFNCDCNFIFSDSRTGITLSAEECGRVFDERCPLVPFKGFGFCSTCPRKCPEGQICCPDGCFGGPSGSSCISLTPTTCPPIESTSFLFTCTDNNNVGSECLFHCSADQFLIGTRRVICLDGDWSLDFEGTTCLRDRDIDSRCPEVRPIRPANCPICPLNCSDGQICCPNGCPGSTNCIDIPEAVTCPPIRSTSFQISCTDNNEVGSECLFSCSADQFLIGTRRVECQENGEWSPDFEGTRCLSNRDIDSRCPEVRPIRPANCPICPLNCSEEQICCPNGCPGSTNCIDIPEAVTCPPIRSTSFQISCSNNNEVGSECLFSCSADQFLIGTRRVECQESGEWSPDFEGTRCFSRRDLDSRCPDVRPIRPANCPICPLNCPDGQVCCPNGCPGSTDCISLPAPTTRPTTPPSLCLKTLVTNMIYFCRISPSLGYFCIIRCNSGYDLSGVRFARCINGEFTPSLQRNRCVRVEEVYRDCTTCG